MQYTSRIILDNKLSMLAPFVYRDIQNIDVWQTRELSYIEPVRFEPIDSDWSEIRVGDH